MDPAKELQLAQMYGMIVGFLVAISESFREVVSLQHVKCVHELSE